MIIKFQERKTWVMFGEIDHLEYGEIPKDEKGGIPDDVLVFTPAQGQAASKHMWISFFTKNMTEATVINAYSPIYIMNDQGQTVETI